MSHECPRGSVSRVSLVSRRHRAEGVSPSVSRESSRFVDVCVRVLMSTPVPPALSFAAGAREPAAYTVHVAVFTYISFQC